MRITTFVLFLFGIIIPLGLLAEQPAPQNQKVKDFYLSNYKENGTRDWEIKGTEATMQDKYVNIDKMEAKYYSKDDVMSVKSDKAKLDKDNMNASLKDNVEVKIPMEDGKEYTTITCDGPVEMEYNQGNAVFNNRVVVTNQGGKLYCDKAFVFFDTTAKKMNRIVAEGNVQILQEDNITYAQRATYYADTKKVVLEGSPRLIYYPKEKKEAKS